MRYTVDVIPVDAIAKALDAVPILIPALGDDLDIDGLLARVDGVVLPGGLTNVHPAHYKREATEADEPFDPHRDATALPLLRRAVELGTPMLMICRGLHELNVAFGGAMRPEPSDRPEKEKHGTPESARTEAERYRLRHQLNIVPGGMLARLVGKEQVLVNSCHSQLVDVLAPGLLCEATANDGTIEAVSVKDARGFALAVAFHPEFWVEQDTFSRAIVEAFGDAVRTHAASRFNLAAAE
jgi:putative glutamine amidotransferase